jgi:O-antigen ligase
MASDVDYALEAPNVRRRRFDGVTLLTFYLVLLIGIPSRLIFAPLGGAGTPSTIIGVAFFIWYLLSWLHPSSTINRGQQPMRRAVVLFFCVVVISYVLASQGPLSTTEQNGADRSLILVCGWMGVLLLAADGIDTMDRLKTLIRRLVFGATAMGILGIVQFITGLNAAQYINIPGLTSQAPYSDVLQLDSLNRPSATAIHPLEFGYVLVLILPLAIHQARYAPSGLRIRRWLQVAIIAGATPMTVSRSAIVGVVVILLVMVPTWSRIERWMTLVAVLGATAAEFLLVHGLLGTLRNLFASVSSDSSTLSRTAAFSHAAPLIAAHPWFGQGFGTFLSQVYFFTDDQYLNSLIEIGVVGLVVLIGLLATGWYLSRSARRASTDPETRDLAQAMAASAAAAIVTYATFDALYFPMAASLTFLILGCAGALWRLTRHESLMAINDFTAPAKRSEQIFD